MELPKRVGIFGRSAFALLKSQIGLRGTQDKATGALAKYETIYLALWIMTVGPGTPVYGTKTKSLDSACGTCWDEAGSACSPLTHTPTRAREIIELFRL